MTPKQAGKRKPRTRGKATPHPGVRILQLHARHGQWVARWIDPDTGDQKQISLTELKQNTPAMRKAWAVKKSRALAARRAELLATVYDMEQHRREHRANELFGKPIDDALQELYDARAGVKRRWSDRTVQAYRSGTDPFRAWCAGRGLRTTGSVTASDLSAFRDWFIQQPAKTPATGAGIGRRAPHVDSGRPRSAAAVNKALNSLRVVLNQCRRRGWTSLHSDTINDSLSYLDTGKRLVRFLRQAEIKALLQAADQHDAATFTYVGRGIRRNARDHKHTQVRPLVLAALLTGCRFAELAGLRWSEVDLEQREIRLDAERVKTRRGREIDLTPCPSLVTLLESMKLQSGGAPFVFGGKQPLSRTVASKARARLVSEFKAPAFDWQTLRRTCATFLVNAPGITAWFPLRQAADNLGHAVQVAEAYYQGKLKGVPREAEILEQAMGIEPLPGKRARPRKVGT